ncbi:putative P-loop containing nucleoside triphosphate hydrolase, leucine-rich repeat domain superfamily [Helianthus annuus]|nr:putative P-loop containing nucleoside triphosphate hydrolase, leucine-rich repeat domain superfamily [Helianthus annuus]
MAELVLSALLPVLFEKLTDAAFKTIARHKGIDAEIKKLQKSLISIQLYLTHASQMEITDPSVKQRLNDLQHLAYDIEDLLDGWATDAMDPEFKQESEGITSKVRKLITPTCCTTFSRTTTMIAELDDISTTLQDLVKEKADLGLDNLGLKVEEETRPRTNNNRRLQTSVVNPSSIVGRQVHKDALVQQLLLPADEPCDQNYSIVPIIGMGGVGKTTLARLVYDEQLVKDHFDLKAWVCVSDEFDTVRISKEIFLSMANNEVSDFNRLQEALKDHIKGKKFLLVLDDIWGESYEDWETLVRPLYTCAPGSKIIITTRKDQLLKQLVYNPLHKQLHGLSDDDALSLLARNALGVENFDAHLSLKPYAEGIVKKCGGLPLALIALGRLLRTKKDEVEHWKEVLNSEIWRLNDEDRIIPALRLSYHDLSAPLKRLFAYCSLFPKDFLFDKEDLVLLWMAEGFLQQATPNDSTEERSGRKFFEELLSRSFFQHAPNNESLFVMHDLMNDLATSVAGEFFVRLDSEAKKDIGVERLKYRYMSFVRETYVTYEKFKGFAEAIKLRTLLATSVGMVESWRGFHLSSKILTDLLPELPLLRVLSLSGFRISELPESIGTLRHLRYLNLSRTWITHLPEKVCNLFNLQTLILFDCYNLTKLPNNFLKLKNLRHLDVRNTRLLFQMLLEIGKLKSLQITLSKIVIESERGTEIAKLKDFENLCGGISIVGLEKVQNANYAHEANFSEKRLSELELVWGNALNDSRNDMLEKEVLNELKPCHDKLLKLKLMSYGGSEFPKWVGDPSFLHLMHVSISGCKRCTSIPPLGQLPSLKELLIKGLQKLQIKDCPNLVEVTLEAMPSLNVLEIEDCLNLVEVTIETLPSLNVLNLLWCDSGVLRSLVEVASAVTKLEIVDISGLNDVVWGGVIEYLGAVEELRIEYCDEIRYVVKSDADASKILVTLRTLLVGYCDNLVRLGEKEEEDLLASLAVLEVNYCKNMERCTCPNGIEELKITDCWSITDVSFPKGGQKTNNNRSSSSMPMLEYVHINDLHHLKSIFELNCLVHLTELEIINCYSLESFPGDNLTSLEKLVIRDCPILDVSFLCDNLTSLEKLEIRNCSKLDVSFPGDNLTSLKELIIRECRTMDASLPGWVWPPNLCFLNVGGLKKPFSEWGPQKFPASLVKLSLYGGGKVSSSSEFSHLLPSSLTSLTIDGFEKLESFTVDLQHLQSLSFDFCPNLKKVSSHPQHLTSLHHLSFLNCPKMMDLPEMVLPSLLSLRFLGDCPGGGGLKERCSKNGSYWPLISHIPCIFV